jgi:nucleotide-binding universal stress UspA family protein
MMKRILLAVDETAGSHRAAEFVDRFFEDTDVHVTAVNVARSPAEGTAYAGMSGWPASTRTAPSSDHEAIRQAEALGEELASQQAPAGADVEAVFGEIVDAIVKAAEEDEADLVVVGTNHPGFVQRLLGHSVSEQLTRSSPLPVLVVP